MTVSVDFSLLPDFADADELVAQAGFLAAAGESAALTAADCHSEWQGLRAVYGAPEAGLAYGAFDKVAAYGTETRSVTRSIKTALGDFAQESRRLRLRSEDLIAASGQCAPPEESGADEEARTAEIRVLQQQVAILCAEYAAAESRCAAGIRAACGLLPDSGLLGSRAFGTTTSLADTVLGQVHHSPVHVRRTLDVSGDLAAELRVENIAYDVIDSGVRYTRTPSGILIPAERVLDLNRPPIPMTDYGRPRPELRLDANADTLTPPGWARWAGRGLFTLDAGVTAWDQGSPQYNSDLVLHPDWNSGERAWSVTQNVAIVGGASLAGGAGGAWAGAKAGAVVGGVFGSWVPFVGTAAGAVVGGIVGGIAGGMVGSGVGEEIGKKAKEIWDSFWD
ncbi:hypothetical protein [Arthrobacter sp.]|uniref:hypothetical protein n=1 Tax=Arthrobacter sp. TaxID=1667 RepID=UPI00289B2295|nr:hypothetical protein [Arthrobacter sp.]